MCAGGELESLASRVPKYASQESWHCDFQEIRVYPA